MMKQYNFPIIFQNVIGEVIPSHILQRRDNMNLENNLLNNDALSITTSSNPTSQISKRKFLRIRSKKMELQRRSKMMKTMNFFAYRPGSKQQNRVQNESSRKFLNFLKKKLVTSDSGCNINKEAFEIEQTDPKKQISSLQSQELLNDPQKRKNHLRIRTSLDTVQKYMDSQKNQEYLITQNADQQFYDKVKRQFQDDNVVQKYFTKNQPVMHKANSFQGKKKGVLSSKFNLGSDQSKKKTVNFTLTENDANEKENQTDQRVKFNSYNSKNSRQSIVKSSRRSKFTRKETNFQLEDEKQNESRWTDRTVVSIKFSQSDMLVKQKKSLRSNESILNKEQNNSVWVKGINRKKTGTHKHIVGQFEAVSQKKYKSYRKFKSKNKLQMKSIPQKSKISYKKINNKSYKSIKTLKSAKNINELKIRKKPAGQRVSLIKKIDNLDSLQNFDSLGVSLRDPNFAETTFKKITSKNLFRNTRGFNQQGNVYDKLNNFHKFLTENETIQSQREIKRTIVKPMVIHNETSLRQHRLNTQGLKKENLIIDMSLQLIRKMNNLAQKRL